MPMKQWDTMQDGGQKISSHMDNFHSSSSSSLSTSSTSGTAIVPPSPYTTTFGDASDSSSTVSDSILSSAVASMGPFREEHHQIFRNATVPPTVPPLPDHLNLHASSSLFWPTLHESHRQLVNNAAPPATNEPI